MYEACALTTPLTVVSRWQSPPWCSGGEWHSVCVVDRQEVTSACLRQDVLDKLNQLMCDDRSYAVRLAAAATLRSLGRVQHVLNELRYQTDL